MDYKEKCKNARAFVVLLAALITWLLNMKYKRDMLKSLIILLIVIIVFYVLSTIALYFIDKIRNMEVVTTLDLPKSQEGEEQETTENTEENT
ncbi:MAG: hypothetical protein ACI4EK_07255 [Wujia sp.]